MSTCLQLCVCRQYHIDHNLFACRHRVWLLYRFHGLIFLFFYFWFKLNLNIESVEGMNYLSFDDVGIKDVMIGNG